MNFQRSLVFLCILLIRVAGSVQVWKTVLLSKKGSVKNVRTELFDVLGTVNSKTPTPNISNVFDVANGRNEFKSDLLDRWAVENHTEIKLCVFNKHGDILWYVTLDGFGTDLTNWLRASRIEGSSDKFVMTLFSQLDLSFNSTGVRLTRTSNTFGWLWVDNMGIGGGTRIMFSTYNSKKYPDGFIPITNAVDMNNAKNPTHTFTLNSAAWWGVAGSARRYYVGFKLKRSSPVDYLTKFQVSYSSEPACLSKSSTAITYKNDDGTDKVFQLNDSDYVNDVAVINIITIYAQCIFVTNKGAVGNPKLVILVYGTTRKYLEGEMFGIQWGFDENKNPLEESVNEIKDTLAIKYATYLYRSKFSSAMDTRGSAVVFGVAGMVVFLLIIAAIVLMDLSTLSRQTRFMKRNFADFKKTLRLFRRALREKRKKFSPVDGKHIKVKVVSGAGAGAGAGASAASSSSSISQPLVNLKPKSKATPSAETKSDKGGEKNASMFKKNVKILTHKKNLATLSKVSE